MEVAESGSCSQTRGTERVAQFTTTSGCNIIMKSEMSVSDQRASLITQIRQTQLNQFLGERKHNRGRENLAEVVGDGIETKTGFEIDMKGWEMWESVEQEGRKGTRVMSESDVVTISGESLKKMLTQVARTSHNHHFRLLLHCFSLLPLLSPTYDCFLLQFFF